MRISMPLAGMDPTHKIDADGRDHAAERAFRMLSEGKRSPYSCGTMKLTNKAQSVKKNIIRPGRE